MSDVRKVSQFPQLVRDPLAWSITLLLAGLAWVPTLQQTLGMLPMRMYGTMGMALLPFLCFWTLMMTAMMLPALTPKVSVRMASIRRQTAHPMTLLIRPMIFILGYLLIWGLFGIPVFVCCLCIDHFVFSLPLLAPGLGIVLFVSAGLYQFTPQKKRALLHCNPAMGCQSVCQTVRPIDSMRVQLRAGLLHGVTCLQCCGIMMMLLIAVGLMNLFWMVLMTSMIFLEKVWIHGHRLSLLLGFAFIFYGLLAFVSPELLSGLSLP